MKKSSKNDLEIRHDSTPHEPNTVELSERIEITDDENIFPNPQPESKGSKIQKYFYLSRPIGSPQIFNLLQSKLILKHLVAMLRM